MDKEVETAALVISINGAVNGRDQVILGEESRVRQGCFLFVLRQNPEHITLFGGRNQNIERVGIPRRL